jgi:hypothetical protein
MITILVSVSTFSVLSSVVDEFLAERAQEAR